MVKSATTLTLKPGKITLNELRRIWAGDIDLALSPDTAPAIAASLAYVEGVGDSGKSVYGINTGFGLLAHTRISPENLRELQRNLVLSHATGTGAYLPDRVVRLILATKVASLGHGLSGVKPETIERLITLYNKGAYPCIPEKGSVGASGDLAPLAHMVATQLGFGRIKVDDKIIKGAEGLTALGLEPLDLGPKEGLALLNGTQVSTALALDALFRIERAFGTALVSGALSVEALRGSMAPFDPRIHTARGHQGQIDVARTIRDLLAGSEIMTSHTDCEKVQDPYSFRCQPQVMGAVLDVIRSAARTLEIEANAVTDNPLIFADTGEALSGGNFHAEPVAFAADMLGIVSCEIASISERRLAVLVDPNMSGQPAFLIEDSGVNSGFMIAQVTAAALVSENKTYAHPASVDSIPTSANQEDHVSMATFAARKAGEIAANTNTVVAIELLAGAQGIDLLRPLKSSDRLEAYVAKIREVAPVFVKDRYFANDIENVRQLVTDGAFLDAGRGLLPSLA